MVFTIGGIREMRSGSRRRGRSADCTAVAEYTGLWGWEVVPGTTGPGSADCPCGAPACTASTAHPLRHAPAVPAGATLDETAAVWSRYTAAAVLLPVGGAFDIIEVAEAAGRRALVRLERMGIPLGPVGATAGGRAHFFVAPGARAQLPELLYRMGWDDSGLDLRCLGLGDHVAAPPTEGVSWLRPPTLDTAASPPPARLVLGTLAYATHRVVG
jgi:hypothetical protein